MATPIAALIVLGAGMEFSNVGSICLDANGTVSRIPDAGAYSRLG